MRTIITPGLFLLAAISAAGCLDDEAPVPDEPPDTEPTACCAHEPGPDGPLGDRLDHPRQARDRLDFLRRLQLPRR